MYHVEWLQTALDELARIWTQADSELRKTLTRASNEIDGRLEINPHDEGESRPYGEEGSPLLRRWQLLFELKMTQPLS
jgi:hypothetical protein